MNYFINPLTGRYEPIPEAEDGPAAGSLSIPFNPLYNPAPVAPQPAVPSNPAPVPQGVSNPIFTPIPPPPGVPEGLGVAPQDRSPASPPPTEPTETPLPSVVPPVPPQASPQPVQAQEVSSRPVPPGSSPVQQAFATPTDPFSDARSVVSRFETGAVRGDPYFTPNGAGSGAFGRYQITPGHYATLRTMFPQEGLPDWEEFKRNPQVQDKAMDLSTRYYQGEAQRRGVPWSNETLLGMHFLGVDGFSKMAQAAATNPNAPVSTVVSQQAIAQNGNIFKDEQGNVRTVADAVQQMRSRFGVGQAGALTGVKEGTPNQTPDSQRPAETGEPVNPYRERLQSLLSQIEDERGRGLDLGEIMFRMGTGILSGKNIPEGLAAGGKLTAEYLNQRRTEAGARDRSLMSGYGALSREKDALDQTKYGRGINVRWWEGEGSNRRERVGIGRMVNGEPLMQNADGRWVPAIQVTGTRDMRFAGLGENESAERGAGDITNAVAVTNIGGVDVPVFEFKRESDGKNYGFGLNGVMAQRRLMALEGKPGFDPTKLTTAVSEWIASKGPISPTQIANLAIPDDQKEYAVSALAYINAVARRESGAQINADEWQRYASMFMPRFGESPDMVQRRSSIRAQSLLPIIAGAGPGAAYLGDLAGGRRSLPERFTPVGDAYIGQTSQPSPGASTGSTGGGTEGSQQAPIKVQGRIDPSSMDDNKYYASPNGTVKSGKEWKQLAASRSQ